MNSGSTPLDWIMDSRARGTESPIVVADDATTKSRRTGLPADRIFRTKSTAPDGVWRPRLTATATWEIRCPEQRDAASGQLGCARVPTALQIHPDMYALVHSAAMLFADRLQKDRAHVP